MRVDCWFRLLLARLLIIALGLVFYVLVLVLLFRLVLLCFVVLDLMLGGLFAGSMCLFICFGCLVVVCFSCCCLAEVLILWFLYFLLT